MSESIWCPAAEEEFRRAKISSSLVNSGLVALISLPILIALIALGLPLAANSLEAAQGILESSSVSLTASLAASWIAVLLMVRRSRQRIRPADRSHVMHRLCADSVAILPFRERELSRRRGWSA